MYVCRCLCPTPWVMRVSGVGGGGVLPEECRYAASLRQKAAFVWTRRDKRRTSPAAWQNRGGERPVPSAIVTELIGVGRSWYVSTELGLRVA